VQDLNAAVAAALYYLNPAAHLQLCKTVLAC
jgi:hypothetical protein